MYCSFLLPVLFSLQNIYNNNNKKRERERERQKDIPPFLALVKISKIGV
jgi:hypothetical protein